MTAAILVALVLNAVPGDADELRVDLQPEFTTIEFTLKATMHTVRGSAALEHGSFVFDTDSGKASGEAMVSASSAGTDNRKRDDKMHHSVLLSARYPVIRLRAESFEGALSPSGASEITLVGWLELLGVERPMRVPLQVTIDGGTATAEASFSVPYVDWGLKDPSTFVLRVGKEVPVAVTTEKASVTLKTKP
jgi:polyisoprenoid-binding protein YceI